MTRELDVSTQEAMCWRGRQSLAPKRRRMARARLDWGGTCGGGAVLPEARARVCVVCRLTVARAQISDGRERERAQREHNDE